MSAEALRDRAATIFNSFLQGVEQVWRGLHERRVCESFLSRIFSAVGFAWVRLMREAIFPEVRSMRSHENWLNYPVT
jgi:hypothetical protein